MKRLDLYPLLEHPETNLSRPGIGSGPPAKQRAIRTAYAVVIRNLYNSVLLFVLNALTNGLFSVSSGERDDQPPDGGAIGSHRRPRHSHQPAGRRQHQAQGEDHLAQEPTAGP
jgi:hypothetical protein